MVYPYLFQGLLHDSGPWDKWQLDDGFVEGLDTHRRWSSPTRPPGGARGVNVLPPRAPRRRGKDPQDNQKVTDGSGGRRSSFGTHLISSAGATSGRSVTRPDRASGRRLHPDGVGRSKGRPGVGVGRTHESLRRGRVTRGRPRTSPSGCCRGLRRCSTWGRSCTASPSETSSESASKSRVVHPGYGPLGVRRNPVSLGVPPDVRG